jgi:glycosyltransferase involved in cell wall biosynthesis
MCRIIVNALSVTNQSGLNVLAGHLGQLVPRLCGTCGFTVLIREDMAVLKRLFEGQVEWIAAPACTARWLPRTVWERLHLARISNRTGARFYFTPSGIAASLPGIPQVVFCQNPWALVPEARRWQDAIKAWLQRRAYRQTMKTADVMVFNSHFMQMAYRENAGRTERRGLVVYQAVDDETRRRAEQWRDRPRKPGQILCVSAMGPHKNVEALIQAFSQLVRGSSVAGSQTSGLRPLTSEPSLHLVGSWPDASYERKIRKLVGDRNLSSRVHFAGFVSREELDRLYAESRVFCLMSRCESFGIPAIEAQVFGTPVVSSNVCAVPEVCGDGGLFVDPDDIEGIAAALERLLTDDIEWQRLSVQASRNAGTYTWERCSAPLVDLFAGLLHAGVIPGKEPPCTLP